MQLSDWMAREGFDDERFGALVQADRGTISRIRRGVNRPSWELAGRIKVATNGEVPADEFLPEAHPAPTEAQAS